LPWLILFDEEVRRTALGTHPEIAVEGGDPSQLPLLERQRLLADIVRRIVSDEDDRSARDNSAIARIANPDLSDDTQQLINEYVDNDDAIFFLGRLVWQGEMACCTASFVNIAADNSRGIYARMASARAVMTCGSFGQKNSLWQQINEGEVYIPRELLAELVDNAAPNSNSVVQLITSLDKLPPYERYKATGLNRSLHEFVKRLPIIDEQQVIAQLIFGLHGYLERPPYVGRGKCHVSEEYAWLLSPATHAVERLVEARSAVALEVTALSIVLMVPALRFWREAYFSEHKGNLQMLVPHWPELNDALYWASIEQARTYNAARSREPMTDDWSVAWLEHFWCFDTDSISRLLDYIRSRRLQDDRLVALSTAFRVYTQAGRPANILSSLQEVTTSEAVLLQRLDILLNPPVSEAALERDEEHEEFLRQQNEREEREKQDRDTWIAELRADPERICSPANLEPNILSNDIYWLMQELIDRPLSTERYAFSDWRGLIPEFGDAVAHAYRNAAINYWRYYNPTLQSEGVYRDNSTPWSLIFAMAGLEIEATESSDFPRHLSESQVRHALRYITWELNGFPGWFERMYQTFPTLVGETVIKELRWELDNTGSDKSMRYILHDLAYHSPWLHASIAPVILEWMETNPTRINTNRDYCIHILVNSGTDPDRLAVLASLQIAQTNDPESVPWWYALRVDCDPVNGIPEVQQWLLSLDENLAVHAAQTFITALMGDKHLSERGLSIGHFRTTEHLKSLYVLMHSYIRAQEDNNRAGSGIYSPDLRDDAQDARNRLFNLLSEIPGKESYTVIKELVHEHPNPDYRVWMAKRAYKRAEEDSDLDPWTAEQVSAFSRGQIITPRTHRQLFDLTVHRLLDLKNWLERGNDSPWQTWQRAGGETEMRTLIAGWLNQQCREQYTTAQEPELSNSQRMDIWMQNTKVHSPVPIELKLLDKKWSGPKLCERLRNQLAGDYLREETAGCGVMLLASQRLGPEKRWRINGLSVGLSDLSSALKNYWQSIAGQYPGVEAIDVIVVDMTQRGKVSDS
uniref:hypothetical protein n=1 Tax=Marinobacterium profundum TaxID=1714300 RepID=UPI0013152B6F